MNYTHYFSEVYIPLILSLSVHEWAHAYAALKLGDDTAKLLGRVTLNPLMHLDFFGTFLLPLFGVPIGWAKPVPFNPLRFNKKTSLGLGTAIVAFAGPISNIVIGTISFIVLSLLEMKTGLFDGKLLTIRFFGTLMYINFALAIFNLIPIPPLDGSHIINNFCPKSIRPYWDRFSSVSQFILVGLLLFYFLS